MIPRLYVQETLAQGARFAADPRAAHYLLNVLRRGEGDPGVPPEGVVVPVVFCGESGPEIGVTGLVGVVSNGIPGQSSKVTVVESQSIGVSTV